MKKTKDAIKYGIETLKISPDKFFGLIESSRDYDGADYSRWLTRKIIEICEEDGVGYSKLLAKKFNILLELAEEDDSDNGIKPEYVTFFKSCISEENPESVRLIGFDADAELSLDDVDWYNGIDYGDFDSFFVCKALEESDPEFTEGIKNNEENCFPAIIKLDTSNLEKDSEIFEDAKRNGILCKSNGSLMLYRICSIATAFCLDSMKFGFMCPVDFLYDSSNCAVIDKLLDMFTVEGYVMSDFSNSIFSFGEYAFCICKSRNSNKGNSCIELSRMSMVAGELPTISDVTLQYSFSNKAYIDKLVENSEKMTDNVFSEKNGEVKTEEFVKGLSRAFGYLNYGNKVILSSNPIEGEKYIPITDNNIEDVIVYYGVLKSEQAFGYYTEVIPSIISGHPKYEELLYNCLPLFLFDVDSRFADRGLVRKNCNQYRLKNHFDILNSGVATTLLEKGEVFFSYEAKELIGICQGFKKFLENKETLNLTFMEMRELADNSDLNEAYYTALNNLKDFVLSLYKSFNVVKSR